MGERKLSLEDFLKTLVKINGTDLHLQSGCVPMIRVDGRARALDCFAPSDAQILEYVEEMVTEEDQRRQLNDNGMIELSYAIPYRSARFRVKIWKSRNKYAIVVYPRGSDLPGWQDATR